nr:SsrA-binding protein [Helicobacter pylori]
MFCVPNHRDFTKLDLQRIRSIISYKGVTLSYKGVTLHASYTKYKCMGVLYCKLAVFIPNTKGV